MKAIFASVGMSGMPATGAATGASTLPMGLMGLGEWDTEDMMFAGMAGGASAPMNPALYMNTDFEAEDMLYNMYAQAAAAAAAPAVVAEVVPDASAVARLLTRARQAQPGFNPMMYGMFEDEDMANMMAMQQYLKQVPTGSNLNMMNGMIYGMDFEEDSMAGLMMMGMGGMGMGGAAAATPATPAAATGAAPAAATGGPAPCGSYKGLLPLDGIDQGEFYLYGPLVRDISACLGGMAINDGVNSDTVAMYAVRRGMQAPAAPAAATPANRRLRRPRYNRRIPQRYSNYGRYAF